MISQHDITRVAEGSGLQKQRDGQRIDLRQTLSRLANLHRPPRSFPQLQSEVSSVISSLPSVVAVFHLEMGDNDLEFRLFRSGGDDVAKNVEQWAANVAIGCCTTEQTRLEQSDDASGSVFQMIAVPIAEKLPRCALVAMFVGDQGNNEKLVLMESAAQCLAQSVAQWQSNQRLTIVTEAAEDLAAQDQLVETVEAAGTLDSACQAMVKALSAYVGTINSATPVDAYVAMATGNSAIKLTAVSNGNTLPALAQRESIEAAMQECLCRSSSLHWPRSAEDPAGVLCLKRMASVVGKTHLTAYPIESANASAGAVGVVILASQQPLSARSFAFVDSCAARLGSALCLVKRAEPGRLQTLFDKVADIRRNRKMLALMALVIVATSFIPLPYYVASECEVRPESKLYIASPFDTTLEKCHVQPGEQVTKDMLLATLDGRETKLELAEVEADLNRAMKQRDGHVVSHQSGEAYVAKYEIERLQSRRDLLLHRQQSLELRSPLEGVVIAGDLKNAEGMPLKVGETLFEVAPLDQLRIELAIPEDDVRYTQQQMPTRIRLDAFPFESWDGTIERIHPASELRNDQNVFVAVVRIENTDGRLRPGMTGYATTKTIWRPAIWNYLHKPAAATARWLGW